MTIKGYMNSRIFRKDEHYNRDRCGVESFELVPGREALAITGVYGRELQEIQ